RREAELRGEFLFRINHFRRDRAGLAGLFAQLFVVLRLAHVRVAGDDVIPVLIGENADQHAGVESTAIRQNDLVSAHVSSLPKSCSIRCERRRVGTPRAGVAKIVSSPANVPRQSDNRALSMARATADAMPGRVRRTTSDSFSASDKIVSPSSRVCGVACALTGSSS